VTGAETAWNWPPLFDYMDRVWINDPTATEMSSFEKNMWALYRNGAPDDPAFVSASINSAGSTVTIVFSQSCTTGVGGSGGVTLSASGGSVAAAYSSGSGSTDYVYNLNRVILTGETVLVGYTQPGNGIEATVGGADVLSFSDVPVTNSSTQIVIAGSVQMKQRLQPTGGF
jgi:hypothetical protein